MKIKGLNIAIASLACLTVIGLAGSTVGTLAWYAYSTRATVAYSGTAVKKAEKLQIGLKWNRSTTDTRALEFKERYEVTYERVGGSSGPYYCFMPTGLGFSSAAIGDYLDLFGHAKNELPPVTSKAYETGDPLTLYESPTYGYPNSNGVAASARYVVLPLAFRIFVSEEGETAKGQDIWLTDVTAEAMGQKDVTDSLRIHVKNEDPNTDIPDTKKSFILHPTAEEAGTIDVAGVLNLNDDDYYDYGDEVVQGQRRYYEYVYGEYDRVGEIPPTLFNEETGFDYKINGVTQEDRHTTFLAKHAAGVEGYLEKFSDYGITPKTAEYLSFDEVAPQDVNGGLSGDYPIAHTSADDDSVGLCTLTIWLEGWDHVIIDDNINARFNLGLQFEINRV